MDRTAKFIRSLGKKWRYRVLEIIEKILAGNLAHLDIRPLEGYEGYFRCRVGNIRIIFEKIGANRYQVIEAGFRKDIYQRLKR